MAYKMTPHDDPAGKRNGKNTNSVKKVVEKIENYATSGLPENVYTDKGEEVNTTEFEIENTTPINESTNTIETIEESDRFPANTTLYINKKDTDYAKKSAFGTRGMTE